RRLHARGGRSPAPLDGGLAPLREPPAVRGEAEGRPAAKRLSAGLRRRTLSPDPRLRRVRVPRVAFGQLRAPRLRLLVAEAPSPRGVLRGAPRQPADGLLRALAARAGRAPPRRRGAPAGRERERLGLHARGGGAAARRAAGPSHGERALAGGGAVHRGEP